MYNPPTDPGHRRVYDLAWIEEQARDHFRADQYLPPEEEADKLAYDHEWDRRQAVADYHCDG
jgi:hypothetical protein